MSISLVKGQKVDLTKGNTGLKHLIVGLGWDINSSGRGSAFDLDSVALCLNSEGKLANDGDMIFYGHLNHSSGAIKHSGDNLTGAGDGVDESILVNLDEVPENIDKIVFDVSIYQANSRHQNFGQVNNAFIQVVDKDTNEELLRYDLSEDFSVETSVILGEIYRHNGEWKFNAKGEGVSGELSEVRNMYL